MTAVLLPILVFGICAAGGVAAHLSWPTPPGRHRMPTTAGRQPK